MAPSSNSPPEFAPRAGRGLSSATRQRLEAVHTRARACLERGDHDYAHDLLTQCLSEDPGALAYAQTFRANIAKKHAGVGKKSSRFGAFVGMSGRGSVAKAAAKGAWADAFTAGCQALKKNPVDLPVLRELADACGELGHADVQLFFLRWALDLDPQDVESNRAAGAALAGVRQFDQAIACWQRVLKARPDDEQARKAVSRLSVEQTLHEGGYDHELLKGDGATADLPAVRVSDLAAKDASGQPRDLGPATPPPPPRSRDELRQAVDQDPADADAAAALAQVLHLGGDSAGAQAVLRRATGASPDPDSPAHAQLEDLRLRVAADQVERAQQQAKAHRTPEAIKLARQVMVQANLTELEVYRDRARRNPTNTRAQHEYGLRLKRGGNHREAIKALQAARGDSRRAAEVQLQLGECFQHIEQFKLAAGSYEAAIKASAPGATHPSDETHKLALYRAGVLALGLGDLDRAETHLTELAGLDFGYRDVGDRLDKVAELRKNT